MSYAKKLGIEGKITDSEIMRLLSDRRREEIAGVKLERGIVEDYEVSGDFGEWKIA
tara:strand:- start:173 stop:340 length:168 start_codon:yes stop_codon:yes gene_type:complete